MSVTLHIEGQRLTEAEAWALRRPSPGPWELDVLMFSTFGPTGWALGL